MNITFEKQVLVNYYSKNNILYDNNINYSDKCYMAIGYYNKKNIHIVFSNMFINESNDIQVQNKLIHIGSCHHVSKTNENIHLFFLFSKSMFLQNIDLENKKSIDLDIDIDLYKISYVHDSQEIENEQVDNKYNLFLEMITRYLTYLDNEIVDIFD
jgi:hypothetical protein